MRELCHRETRSGDFEDALVQVQKEIQTLSSGVESPTRIRSELKMIMWELAGPVRHEDLLREALERISVLSAQSMRVETEPFCQQLVAAPEVKAMLTLSEAVVKSCLARTESRGHHFRDDYPHEHDEWCAHTRARMVDGEVVVDKVPV